MNPETALARAGRDRCPGALAPFQADDGLIVRARVPGGEVTIDQLDVLMTIGRDFGTPLVQITTRANLQVRGLPSPLADEVAERMADAGLLPSRSHEKARNVLANPLSAQSRARARELDRLLCERPELADLPGRFLFLVTDTSGIGLSEPYDVAYVDRGDGRALVVACGRERECSDDEGLQIMLDTAADFLRLRENERQWNLRDLDRCSALLDGWREFRQGMAEPLVPSAAGEHLIAGIPLGLIDERHLTALRRVGARVVVTPWRSVVVPGGSAHRDMLAEAGFITEAASPWSRISACTGAPHCGRAQSETMDLAHACATTLPTDGVRLHLVGCERRCGHPRTDHVCVVGAHTVDGVVAAVASNA